MKTYLNFFQRAAIAGSAALLLAAVISVRAHASAETKEAARLDALANNGGGTQVVASLSSRFATFAGSQANATALINGLHAGTTLDLTATVNGQTAVTTLTPPTGKLGYGEVFLSLALAQEQLTKLGITQPTPAQIEAALNGGSVTTGSGATAKTTQLSGVLALRSQGKGWGQIAQSLGVKLGTVVSDLHAANLHLNDRIPQTPGAEASEQAAAHAAEAARPDVPSVSRPEIPNPPAIPGHH